MPNYRRNRVPGATYFFTVTLHDRKSDLLVRQIGRLRAAVSRVRLTAPFYIDAWVVLPEHMHCLWTLPEGDADFPGRWWAIKAGFSRGLPEAEKRAACLDRRNERGVWQRRYWEHTIRDDADYAAHMDYTHFNPVKHGLATHPAEWPFSTFRRCARQGIYPLDWMGVGGRRERCAYPALPACQA